MISWYWFLGGGILSLIIALLFEPVRDFLKDIFEDIFSDFWDIIIYIITFQWVGDIPELIGGLFEGIGEFSVYGVVFGAIMVIFVFFTQDYLLGAMIVSMGSGLQRGFWTIATYVACFCAGYLMGNKFEQG